MSAEQMVARPRYEIHAPQGSDFVLVIDRYKFELTGDDLLRRLYGPVCCQCGGFIKASQGGSCMPCLGESS